MVILSDTSSKSPDRSGMNRSRDLFTEHVWKAGAKRSSRAISLLSPHIHVHESSYFSPRPRERATGFLPPSRACWCFAGFCPLGAALSMRMTDIRAFWATEQLMLVLADIDSCQLRQHHLILRGSHRSV